MAKEYPHAELDKKCYSISGYYIVEKEERLKYKEKEVLYVIGHAVIDNSCCGVGGCCYALVPGYVINWKTRDDDSENPVSDVEPVTDTDSKVDIARIIKDIETVTQIEFW